MAAALPVALGMGVSMARPSEASPGETGSALVRMGAVELSKAIQSRAVSCAEVMTAYLDHIDRVNPRVNAIVSLQSREDLLRQARGRDDELARGDYLWAGCTASRTP